MTNNPILRKAGTRKSPPVWTLRVSVTDEHGVRSQPSRTFKGTETMAIRKLREFEQELAHKTELDRTLGSITFGALFEQWVVSPSAKGKPKSPSTIYQDRNRYKTHLKTRFETRRAAEIDANEIYSLYEELRATPSKKTGKPISERTLHKVHEIVRAMYYFGLRRKLITSAPFPEVSFATPDLPDPSAPQKKDVIQLLTYLRKHDLELFCAVNIAGVTGARRGEVVALKFSDIDSQNMTIRITKGLIDVPGLPGFFETITKTGEVINDGVGVGATLTEALHELLLIKMEKGINHKRVMHFYIFSADSTGKKPWCPDTITSRLRRAQEKSFFPRKRMTLRDLRTFVASDLVGRPFGLRIASDTLRHKSASTTLRYYLAAEKKRNREATTQLANELAGLDTASSDGAQA